MDLTTVIVSPKDLSLTTNETATAAAERDTSGVSGEYHWYTVLQYSYTTCRLVTCLVGILANSLVLVSSYMVPRIRSASNFFLCTLALVDCCNLVMDLLWFIPFDHFETAGWDVCVPVQLGITMTFAAIVNLTIIALDRYVYIEKPMMYIPYIERNHKAIGIGTLLAVVFLMLPTAYTSCCRFDRRYQFEFIYGFLLLNGVLFLLIGGLYSSIFLTASRHQRRIRRNSLRHGGSVHYTFTSKQRRMVMGYVLIVGIAFVSLASNMTGGLVFRHIRESSDPVRKVVDYFNHYFSTFNSACNPFVYYLTQNKYRQAFLDILFCRLSVCRGNVDLEDPELHRMRHRRDTIYNQHQPALETQPQNNNPQPAQNSPHSSAHKLVKITNSAMSEPTNV